SITRKSSNGKRPNIPSQEETIATQVARSAWTSSLGRSRNPRITGSPPAARLSISVYFATANQKYEGRDTTNVPVVDAIRLPAATTTRPFGAAMVSVPIALAPVSNCGYQLVLIPDAKAASSPSE